MLSSSSSLERRQGWNGGGLLERRKRAVFVCVNVVYIFSFSEGESERERRKNKFGIEPLNRTNHFSSPKHMPLKMNVENSWQTPRRLPSPPDHFWSSGDWKSFTYHSGRNVLKREIPSSRREIKRRTEKKRGILWQQQQFIIDPRIGIHFAPLQCRRLERKLRPATEIEHKSFGPP